MNKISQDIAIAAFQASTNKGEEFAPTALKQLLKVLKQDCMYETDLNSLATEIRIEIEYIESLHNGHNTDERYCLKWEGAIRWTLRQIKEWGREDGPKHIEALRALVTSAYVLDVEGFGLARVASFIVTEQVRAGLAQLLADHMFRPLMNDRTSREAHDEVRDLAAAARYDRILPRYHHLFFGPGGDFSACVILLHATFPETLAETLELKDDINFSALVNEVLREKALRYALEVSNIGFKFACVAPFLHANRDTIPSGYDAPLGALLLQVARSSDQNWERWMQAFFKYPGAYDVLEKALASELPALEERHWLAFLRAPLLGYSYQRAASFANLIMHFGRAAGDEPFARMCKLAYQVWDEWNYRERDPQSFMFSPRACAFDFPVAVHYANHTDESLSVEELRLKQAIDSIEQQWFDSASALLDERYRLMSRLRLVLHGRALKNGSTEALPPKIEQEAHHYYRARYMYSSPAGQ
jgi:hypothetical protein